MVVVFLRVLCRCLHQHHRHVFLVLVGVEQWQVDEQARQLDAARRAAHAQLVKTVQPNLAVEDHGVAHREDGRVAVGT